MERKKIGIGVVGAGYMGKAHSVAMQAVGAVFDTALRPECEMICTRSDDGAKKAAQSLGFARYTSDWRHLVSDPKVQAIVIASPQQTHLEIALAAFEQNKPVFCEKPLGASLQDAKIMTRVANASGAVNMVGFNYIRTPASQLARQIVQSGEIGEITYFRGEHTEDFLADPNEPANWRTDDRANGTMGDLAPHMVNGALAHVGPINALVADIQTVHVERPSDKGPQKVTNDDHGQIMCRFENGAMGNLYFSRVATGRKMGYVYEMFGTKGAIRFDQEDQNALWVYEGSSTPDRQGFKKILTGPHHPDYVNFCLGPGHGTGYQDQIIIEARDFLKAIETNTNIWPTFADGLMVSQVVDAAWRSSQTKQWVEVEHS